MLARANSDPAAILTALGEPTLAGVTPLYKSYTLTILNVVWGRKDDDHAPWYGEPAVQISENARWTLRALAGGYCRGKNIEPEPGPYRTLMTGIEAALGVARLAVPADDDDEERQNYSIDKYGRRYKSTLPQRERRRMH